MIDSDYHSSIAVYVNPDTVKKLGLARSSAATYPPSVRRAMANGAAESLPILRSISNTAAIFKPRDVQSRVREISDTSNVLVLR